MTLAYLAHFNTRNHIFFFKQTRDGIEILFFQKFLNSIVKDITTLVLGVLFRLKFALNGFVR